MFHRLRLFLRWKYDRQWQRCRSGLYALFAEVRNILSVGGPKRFHANVAGVSKHVTFKACPHLFPKPAILFPDSKSPAPATKWPVSETSVDRPLEVFLSSRTRKYSRTLDTFLARNSMYADRQTDGRATAFSELCTMLLRAKNDTYRSRCACISWTEFLPRDALCA